MKKRYEYLDGVKAIGILMVVISHICNTSGISNPIRDWFNPFMVGLFFMVSGYLYRLRGTGIKAEGFCTFMKKRVNSLAVPYVFFCGMAALIQLIAAYERRLPVGQEGLRLAVDFITLKGFGPIWFLPVMFLAETGFWMVIRRNWSFHVTMVAAGVFFAYASSSLAAFLFRAEEMGGWILWAGAYIQVFAKAAIGAGTMVLGYYVLFWLDYLKNKAVLILTVVLSLAGSVGIVKIYNMDFNGLDFGRYPLLYFADCILGTVLVVICCKLAEPWIGGSFLSYMGKNTLTIMCTHTEWYLVPMISAGWAAVAGQATVVGERYYGELVIKLLFLLAAETGVIELLGRYCPFIPGSGLYRKLP